ncbi:PorP/SprF family type IX secretion system membrane protein [Lishizhenia sp.]|uniref:PorP/SprF family type IX secretion system membrane protein n=1 Tax=Lishizhenia sp. TaxID=2497594 RepID=UPI00299D651A|nr:PorP/SprF family type IX secretion system membrane protein [Lishizhenia sp.]MDX1444617.1 PorP/SprF family type IX secretion system membrane protein [Lishizhenia sp.]
MRYIFYLFICFSSSLLFAQQLGSFSMWSENSFAYNPSFAGITKKFEFKTGYKEQWAGFDGAPNIGLLTFNAPMVFKRGNYLKPYHGVGLNVQRDQAGEFTHMMVGLNYAFHIPLDRTQMLSFGTSLGLQQLAFDQINATTVDPDLTVGSNVTNIYFPRVTLGALYNNNDFYLGLSGEEILRNKWTAPGTESRFRMHYSLQGGYKFDNKYGFCFLPRAKIDYVRGANPQASLMLIFDYFDKFAFGLGYRTEDAITGMLRLRIKEMYTIAYSYDFTTSSLQSNTFGTHEIMFSFKAGKLYHEYDKGVPVFD